MNERLIYLSGLWIILLSISSCSKSDQLDFEQEIPKSESFKRLDIDLNHSGLIDTDILDNIQYIGLNTEKNLLAEPDDVFFHNNIYYIFDSSVDRLDMFSSEGNHINSIDSKGKGPGEYIDLLSISYDCESEKIFLYDGVKKSFFIYTFKGDFLETIELPVYFQAAYYIGDQTFLGYKSYLSQEDKWAYNVIFMNAQGDVVHKSLPFTPNNTLGVASSSKKIFQSNCNRRLFTEFLSNKIYDLSNSSLKVKYEIHIAGELETNRDKIYEELIVIEEKGDQFDHLKNSKYPSFFESIHETKQYISFKFNYAKKTYSVFFDKLKNEYYVFEGIFPFSKGNNLLGISSSYVSSNYDENKLYIFLSCAEILYLWEHIILKKGIELTENQQKMVDIAQRNKQGLILTEVNLK